MRLEERFGGDIFRSEINWIIGILFIGSFSLGAILIILQTAYNDNPIADGLATMMQQETQLPN